MALISAISFWISYCFLFTVSSREDSLRGFHLAILIIAVLPQTRDRIVDPTAKYINFNYALSDYRNDHWVHLETRGAHSEPDLHVFPGPSMPLL